jgi:hypothetical protein
MASAGIGTPGRGVGAALASDEWTNVSLITFMGTPMANSSEPAEWRSSCVVQAPSPALEPTRAKWRLKLFGSIAVPIGVVKTRPAPAH